jgi:uncharacterized membrane protein YfcA
MQNPAAPERHSAFAFLYSVPIAILGGLIGLGGVVVPMGLGSVIGSLIGGLLVGSISASILKLILGLILNVSAWRMFRHRRAMNYLPIAKRE